MVCKNTGIYGFLGTSWVLITMVPRSINEEANLSISINKSLPKRSPTNTGTYARYSTKYTNIRQKSTQGNKPNANAKHKIFDLG